MNETTQGRAQWLADFLERSPQTGYLALTILALLVVFALFLLEKNAHQKTIREVVTLLTTVSQQWDRSLDLEEKRIENEHYESSARHRFEMAADVPPMPSTRQERPP